MRLIQVLAIFSLTFSVAVLSAQIESSPGSGEEENAFEQQVLNWDDEELDFVDEVGEAGEELHITSVRIESIVMYIDDILYENPGSSIKVDLKQTHPALVMKEILFRVGDVMGFNSFKGKLNFSVHNIESSGYFYTGSTIEFFALQRKDEDGNDLVKVLVHVRSGFGHFFAGGNTYAVYGRRYPFGLLTKYYAGPNRVEAHILYDNISLGSSTDSYGTVFMDLGIKNYLHWLSPVFHGLDYSALQYGLNPLLGFSFTPFLRLETGLGLFAVSMLETLNNQGNNEVEIVGLPNAHDSTVTLDTRNALSIEQRFGHTGLYSSYVQFRVPYILGIILGSNTAGIPAYGMYDMGGGELAVQVGAFWGIHHAFLFRGAAAGSIFFVNHPYIGKANLGNQFYNNIFFNLQRRGNYASSLTAGSRAFSVNLEYRMGLFMVGVFVFELLVFYDVASAADTVEDWGKNVRHTVGPGLGLHFLSPVDLVLRVSLGFGGPLLNPEGSEGDSALSFDFGVEFR